VDHKTIFFLCCATNNTNTYFRVWGGAGDNNTNSPLDFVVTNASPVVGVLFEGLPAGNRTLNLPVNGAGNVSRSPQANYYATGSLVTISATPAPGNIFMGWSGGITGTNVPTNVTLDASLTITANFVSTNAPPPQPPVVALAQPLTAAQFTSSAPVTVNVSASDPNAGGSITQVILFAGTTYQIQSNSSVTGTWIPFETNTLNSTSSILITNRPRPGFYRALWLTN
jgi:hypothetical protein